MTNNAGDADELGLDPGWEDPLRQMQHALSIAGGYP